MELLKQWNVYLIFTVHGSWSHTTQHTDLIGRDHVLQVHFYYISEVRCQYFSSVEGSVFFRREVYRYLMTKGVNCGGNYVGYSS